MNAPFSCRGRIKKIKINSIHILYVIIITHQRDSLLIDDFQGYIVHIQSYLKSWGLLAQGLSETFMYSGWGDDLMEHKQPTAYVSDLYLPSIIIFFSSLNNERLLIAVVSALEFRSRSTTCIGGT